MFIILFLSLNVVLLQGIPVDQERVSREKRENEIDEFNECTLPERLDPFSKWKTLFTYVFDSKEQNRLRGLKTCNIVF